MTAMPIAMGHEENSVDKVMTAGMFGPSRADDRLMTTQAKPAVVIAMAASSQRICCRSRPISADATRRQRRDAEDQDRRHLERGARPASG